MGKQDISLIGYCGLNCADFAACDKLEERLVKNIKKIKKVGIEGFITAKS